MTINGENYYDSNMPMGVSLEDIGVEETSPSPTTKDDIDLIPYEEWYEDLR